MFVQLRWRLEPRDGGQRSGSRAEKGRGYQLLRNFLDARAQNGIGTEIQGDWNVDIVSLYSILSDGWGTLACRLCLVFSSAAVLHEEDQRIDR